MAWAAPVIAAASTAPFVAASGIARSPGLNGWVQLKKDCTTDTLTINGQGNFTGGGDNDRGIWIFDNNNDPGAGIANPFIVFYYPTALGTLTWSAVSGNSNWSVPVLNTTKGPAKASYNRYITYYTGRWTYSTTHKAWVANGKPNFSAPIKGALCGTKVSVYGYRAVDVQRPDDTWETVAFIRGPVSL